jgi:hypothetical protein
LETLEEARKAEATVPVEVEVEPAVQDKTLDDPISRQPSQQQVVTPPSLTAQTCFMAVALAGQGIPQT